MSQLPETTVSIVETETVTLSRESATRILEALVTGDRFFVTRDKMNAAVHTTTPHWSPITTLVRDALIECTTAISHAKQTAAAAESD